MENYFPYIVSVVCSLISGFANYIVARKQSKEDMNKLKIHMSWIWKRRKKNIS